MYQQILNEKKMLNISHGYGLKDNYEKTNVDFHDTIFRVVVSVILREIRQLKIFRYTTPNNHWLKSLVKNQNKKLSQRIR